eukprot:7235721-Pyramimonas_sp.AAC.2
MASSGGELEDARHLDGFNFGGFLLVVVHSEEGIPCEVVGEEMELQHARGNCVNARFVLDSGLELGDDPSIGTRATEGTP